MPCVTTQLVALDVRVTPGTPEMGFSVQVSDKFHAQHITGVCIRSFLMINVFTSLVDIEECDLDTDNCDVNANCTDTDGSFICTCNQGYEGDGVNCTGMCVYELKLTI